MITVKLTAKKRRYRITKYTHVDHEWYRVQRRILGMWFEIGHNTYTGSFRTFEDAEKYLNEYITKVTERVMLRRQA